MSFVWRYLDQIYNYSRIRFGVFDDGSVRFPTFEPAANRQSGQERD